jgi:predicted RNA polymerase sigma factor
VLIRRGLAAIAQTERCGRPLGAYVLQAAIAARHARAREAAETVWGIAALCAELAAISPSPVVQLNRAVARSMALGPQAGLDLVDTLVDQPAMKTFHLLPSVRADLLMKPGRVEERCPNSNERHH